MSDFDQAALDALALVEQLIDGNAINWTYILDTTDHGALLYGLTKLAKALLLSDAANTGSSVRDVIEAHRTMFLLAEAGEVA